MSGLIGVKGGTPGQGGLASRGGSLGGGGPIGTIGGGGGLGVRGVGPGSGPGLGPKSAGAIPAAGGPVTILGALPRHLIDEVVKSRMQQIRYCYSRQLTRDPSLSGKLVVKFTIARDGTVSSAGIKSSTLADPAVGECVTSRFYRMQFPEPRGGGIVVVSYPFLFAPG